MKKHLFYQLPINKHTVLVLLSCFIYPFASIHSQNYTIKNGVNIQASYYNRGVVNMGWDLMENYPAIEAVRIEIEPNRASQARRWIKEAHQRGYQVIATYHSASQLGSNKVEDLQAAANWWRNHYQSLSSSGPIIINIMNEWSDHDILPMDFANAYNEAIPIIREVYEGPLIVDVPGFGQATDIAAAAFPYFQDQQIIFSVHIYTNAFNTQENRWLNEADLANLSAVGAQCMVGEFCDASRGGADWCGLVDYCYQNDWAIFGWAWNGDGGNMNMIEPHWRNQPLATSFRPTPFMDRITARLRGVPCYTQADQDCTADLIGTPCDDRNTYTINDRYNEHCHCTGSFTDALPNSSISSTMLIYPNPIGNNSQAYIELIKIRQKGVFSIINNLGQEVKGFTVAANEKTLIIDTSSFRSGLYWAVFQAEGQSLVAEAFIK